MVDGEGVKVSGTSNSLPWPVGDQGKGGSRRRQNSTGHHLHTLPITHYHLGTPNPRRLRPFHQNNTKAFDQHRPGSTIDSSLLLSFTSPVAPARVCLTTTDLLAISLFIASVSLLCILCLVGHHHRHLDDRESILTVAYRTSIPASLDDPDRLNHAYLSLPTLALPTKVDTINTIRP